MYVCLSSMDLSTRWAGCTFLQCGFVTRRLQQMIQRKHTTQQTELEDMISTYMWVKVIGKCKQI